ncbi:MAG TPA: hypothetical protein VES19_12630 [Candidatus Limnocylindrales bacterium]|nr:hypothetical protein [Candidatus Limnocylindrales bacterium]
MGEGDVSRRYREELHAGVAGLLAFMIAVTLWGLATPVFSVRGAAGDAGAEVWIDANESSIDIVLVLAAAPVATLIWTLLVVRRVPWPIGPRRARVAYRRALLVVPVIVVGVLGLAVAYLPQGEVWVDAGTRVIFGQVPPFQAARAVVMAAGVGLAVIVSVPLVATVLRRLDPSRPAVWLAGPAKGPHPAPTRPEPAA